MKLNLIASLGLVIVTSSQLRAEANFELKEIKDKASYAIGLNMGTDFHQESLSVNPEAMAAGLKDGLAGVKPQLTETECKEALAAWQKEESVKLAAHHKELAEKNKKEGEKFLADNKTKEGVNILPSGAQYKVLKAGTGASPKPSSIVKTHCRGLLIDGTEFFSTYKENDPARFTVNKVIKGWSEVLPLMTVGSKWQVVLPAELAYGEQGAGGQVGPNATLIFEIELLSIES